MTAGSPQELIDRLHVSLGLSPAEATSPEQAATQLLELSARPEVAWTRLWIHPQPEEAGVSVTLAEDAGPVVIRQPVLVSLHRALVEVLSQRTARGADPRRPHRGGRALESGWLVRAAFRDHPHGPWVTLSGRAPQSRRGLRELPMDPAAADFLDAALSDAERLFPRTVLVVSGEPASGRSATLRALFDALPDEVRVSAATSPPLPHDPRLAEAAAAREPLNASLRSIRRQDPDVVIADELQTDEELQLFAGTVLSGAGAIGVVRSASPERALQRLHEAFEGVRSAEGRLLSQELEAWILHHLPDGGIELHTAIIGSDAAPGPVRWRPA